MKIFKYLILLVFFINSLIHSQSSEVRSDGNWWITQSNDYKQSYISGFFRGMMLGFQFTLWGINDLENLSQYKAQVEKAFRGYEKKYLSNVANTQIVDGLDSLYRDYKNRRIHVVRAVWIVVNGIAGMQQEELDDLIESFRESSTK
ncbi:MAG: hypothetical protein ABI550_08470 [Ignavibacteriaceae bacterium]